MPGSLGRVVLEQPWSGYLKASTIDAKEGPSWTTEDELQELVGQAPEAVDVYSSTAISARAWQRLERERIGHRGGAAGGLAPLT